MSDMFPETLPTLAEQIREVRREIEQRETHYPRFVRNGIVTQARADRQLASMRAVLDTLERMRNTTTGD